MPEDVRAAQDQIDEGTPCVRCRIDDATTLIRIAGEPDRLCCSYCAKILRDSAFFADVKRQRAAKRGV
jgi:hypothetical protein